MYILNNNEVIKNRLYNYLISPYKWSFDTRKSPGSPPQDSVHICCFTIFRPTNQKLLNLEWFSFLKNNL